MDHEIVISGGDSTLYNASSNRRPYFLPTGSGQLDSAGAICFTILNDFAQDRTKRLPPSQQPPNVHLAQLSDCHPRLHHWNASRRSLENNGQGSNGWNHHDIARG